LRTIEIQICKLINQIPKPSFKSLLKAKLLINKIRANPPNPRHPRSILNHPRSIPNHPRSIPNHPRSIPNHPRSIPNHPRSILNHPRSIPNHPRSILNHPRSSKIIRVPFLITPLNFLNSD